MELVHIALTQMSMKSGLCKYKREEHPEVTKEFRKLHTQEAFGSLRAEDMIEEQKKDALEILVFIKERRDGTIKARGYADGRKQRKKYNNTDVTPPTVSTEAVLISAVIDVYEERDVAVVNIPGVYMSSDMGNDVFVIFCGTMAELMVSDDPTLYWKYTSYGKKL